MYQSYEDFIKKTEESHAAMVPSGQKMSLDAYRHMVAQLLGHPDVDALKVALDATHQPSYVLVSMWQGVTDSVNTYKVTELGKAHMIEDFTAKVKDHLTVLPDGSLSSEDQCILDDALENLFYEDSKITVTCYLS